MLELSQIELAFINIPLIEPTESIAIEPIYKVAASIFVAGDHELAQDPVPSPEALSQAKWAVVDKPHSIELFDALFLTEGLPAPHIAVRTNSLTLIRAMILNDGFVGLIPHHMLKHGVASEHSACCASAPS